MKDLISWRSAFALAVAYFLYNVCLAFYRLYFHPLSKIPGPRLAAATRFYEYYYDVLLGGRYTFKIAEMHQKYGPIIRISPNELHVSDPAFFEVLFRQGAHYDKYDWALDAFDSKGSTIATIAHNVHKARRATIAPFFAQARVVNQQDMIRRHLENLQRRLEDLAGDTAFDMGAATSAFMRDVTSEFVLNKSYDSLDTEDFEVYQARVSGGIGKLWRLNKPLRFIIPVFYKIPLSWLVAITDGDYKQWFQHLLHSQEDTKRYMAEALSSSVDTEKHPNLIHGIMNSPLPPSEKEFRRVFQDTFTILTAGFETVSTILRLVLFHVYDDEKMLQRLRAELAAANIAPDELEWKALEPLPYLSAVIHEGMRLLPAVSTRMARVAPVPINYNDWEIPARTPVGMTSLLMHTDEALWPEPKRYNPDRWIQEDGTMKRVELGFAPFSKGTRNCLGMHLAWAEMYMFVAFVVQRFDFTYPEASAEDFECIADEYTPRTRTNGRLIATVSVRKA